MTDRFFLACYHRLSLMRAGHPNDSFAVGEVFNPRTREIEVEEGKAEEEQSCLEAG
jgi:hypothetical protein